MRNVWQFVLAILTAVLSIALVLGGFSLALAESNRQQPGTPPAPSDTPAEQPFTPSPQIFTPTWQPYESATASATPLPATASPTLPPPPTSCPAPDGWQPYLVQAGDTLADLAERYQVEEQDIRDGNCLWTVDLLPGVVVYLPAVATPTPVPCGPPSGWVRYTVRRGDTMYRISKTYGISVAQLQRANCLSGTFIRTGQVLYVPFSPYGTPIQFPPFNELTPTPYETPIEIWFDIPTEEPTPGP